MRESRSTLPASISCPSPIGLTHTARLHDEDEYRTYRIEIGGVVVRYVEDSYSIQVTVEGTLPVETVAQLRSDITAKLEALEQSPAAYRDIET